MSDRRLHASLIALVVVPVLFVAWIYRGCLGDLDGCIFGAPSSEDERRAAILAGDPLFDEEIVGLTPDGPLLVSPGMTGVLRYRSSPTEVIQRYRSDDPADETFEAMVSIAEEAGWTVTRSNKRETHSSVTATRDHEGFEAGLRLHVTQSNNETEVSVITEAPVA